MSKYGNKRTMVDNIAFDSKAEAERYKQLKMLEQAGEIIGLEVHQRWPLHVPAVEPSEITVLAVYEADFSYHTRDFSLVVEDVKGVRTAMYRLKRKWLKAEYGIDIVEIEA